jgi:hypothetical protein
VVDPLVVDGGDAPGFSRKREPYRAEPVERPKAAVPYAELHCHTNFSFLDGASDPEELVAEAPGARFGWAGTMTLLRRLRSGRPSLEESRTWQFKNTERRRRGAACAVPTMRWKGRLCPLTPRLARRTAVTT